jgi:glutamine synthetase type III
VQPLNQQDKPSTWMRLSNDLKRRKDLTSNAKLVYTHMLDKYIFFSRQDKEYYENMQDIGEELGIARKTVNDAIKALEEAQMLVIFKKKLYERDKSVVSHSYVVKDIYNLYVPAKVLQMKPASRVYSEDEPF